MIYYDIQGKRKLFPTNRGFGLNELSCLSIDYKGMNILFAIFFYSYGRQGKTIVLIVQMLDCSNAISVFSTRGKHA
jgi:hypothetical protein